MRFCLRHIWLLLSLVLLAAGCNPIDPDPKPGPDPVPPVDPTPVPPARTGESGITYQLLVYSFADSNGDGVGDFNGIKGKLDYLKSLGVQAVWLSPIHPATSYHGYDVEDYDTVNPKYGTEAEFKALLDAAHAKGMKVYLDFVLNHTSKNHPWFLAATGARGGESPFRDYYHISSDPRSDIIAGRFPMIPKNGYNAGEWSSIVSDGSQAQMKVKFTLTCDASDKPKSLKIEQVETVSNTGSLSGSKWLWWGDPGQNSQFYSNGGGIYTLSMEIRSPWGVLVRTSSTQWDSYKFGAPSGKNQLKWGEELALSNTDNQDILLPGMTQEYYLSVFGSYMPDINYGAAATCETSEPFKQLTAAADKWINLGVDGFRLDAVKHIYHDASSDENPTFLKKFYDHCNATYKAAGHSGDIYMVGEHFSEPDQVAPYYKGLPAFFEFAFWWRLKDAVGSGNGASFSSALQNYRTLYSQQRSSFIEATKLSNHDEDRAGNDLGRNVTKMKFAGAVLLTACGEPYIYQGEELGYWGSKSGGDEYVRTPMLWKADGSSLASKELGDKMDKAMLTATMSVESQENDANSILNLYKKFGVLRDSYPALAKGSFTPKSGLSSNAVAAWTREYGGQKIFVIHNFGSTSATLTIQDVKLTEMIASNGTVTVSGTKLTIGAYASAVFLQ